MIEVSNLTRYYGEFAALKGVSFTVKEGEIIGLLGLNGAGKSTTLKVLAGLIPPSEGRVVIDGVDVADAPDAFKSRIGYLPEDPPLYLDMTVSAFIAHIGRLRGMTAADVQRRVPEVMALTDISDRKDQVIGTLSHGYRKRVGIASTVMHNPRLVILDEPISGLDPKQIIDMRRVIRNLREGRAVMVSSHILPEISQTCDRIFLLKGGQLIGAGTEDELTHRVGHARIKVTVRATAGAFETFLKQNPHVAAFELRATADGAHDRAGGAHPQATIDLHGDVREAFLADLVTAGLGLRLVEGPDHELESMFLEMTQTKASA
jgi:ABC-2 type transport system ATP-binding protein